MTKSIPSEEQLDDLLSEPTPEVIETLGRLEGDVLILGVAGKMGPTLARMAARASHEAGIKRKIIGVRCRGLGDELQPIAFHDRADKEPRWVQGFREFRTQDNWQEKPHRCLFFSAPRENPVGRVWTNLPQSRPLGIADERFCARRTDLDVVQVPSSIPAVGNLSGANQVVSDPDFHNSIVRTRTPNSRT